MSQPLSINGKGTILQYGKVLDCKSSLNTEIYFNCEISNLWKVQANTDLNPSSSPLFPVASC